LRGAIAIPLASLSMRTLATGAASEQLDPEDPAAKNLNYKHASSDADKRCRGCQFYTDPSAADWGPCVLFPEKRVNANGICNSWFQRV